MVSNDRKDRDSGTFESLYLECYSTMKNTGSQPYHSTVLDRIIQECVRLIIEPICEARFYPHSYGFRPYRAQKHAIRDIINVINAGKEKSHSGLSNRRQYES